MLAQPQGPIHIETIEFGVDILNSFSHENRIAVERRKFNEITRGYNTTIRKVPASMIAGITGFDQKGYFKAQEGSDVAPTVEF